LPRRGDARLVRAFVDRGGEAIFLPPQAPDDGELFGMRWGSWRVDGADLPVESWRDDQGLLANSLSGQALPVGELAAKDAVLFLWGTWPKLPQVVETMRVWGFEHVTGFPWVKTTRDGKPLYGIGSWVAGCSEYVLIGRCGNVSPPDVDKYLGLVGPSLGHSRKPDDVYAIAEALPGPYLELFARRTRPGWTVFGNEIEKGQQVQS